MAVEQPPNRETSADLSQVQSDAVLAPAQFHSQAIDLNVSDAELDSKWHVGESNRLSIEARLDSGAWDNAKVNVVGSIDAATWTVITVLTKIGFKKNLDQTDT